MFGIRRRKATQTAIEALQPMVSVIERTRGIPDGFWKDPYVLGFFSGGIGVFAKLASNGKIKGTELGRVLIDSLDSLSQGQGNQITRSIVEFQQSRNLDFLKGVGNADKIISVAYGFSGYEDDPDIIEAKKRTKLTNSSMDALLGPTSETAALGGQLQMMLFYDVVNDRFQDHH